MRIYVTCVSVDNQAEALTFYTDKLGFKVKHDIPLGTHRWLTVVSQEEPEGTELLLEPSEHPAVKPYKDALVKDGIPAVSFKVQDLNAEFARLRVHGVADGCRNCANGGSGRHLRKSRPTDRNEIGTGSVETEASAGSDGTSGRNNSRRVG